MDTATKSFLLETGKDFSVPASRLYEAWTKEEDLKQWWRPMGNNLKQLTNDLKQGGEVRYVFENDRGEESFTIQGKYDLVKEGEELQYSWNWEIPSEAVDDSQYRLTIRFIDQDGGSHIAVKQENFTTEESIRPHREGWEKALQDLADYVAKEA